MKKFTYGVITTGIILSLAMTPVFADEAQEKLMEEPVSSEVEILKEIIEPEEVQGEIRTISAPAEIEGDLVATPELRSGEMGITAVEDTGLVIEDIENPELVYTTSSLVREDNQKPLKKAVPYAVASGGILAAGLLLRKKLRLV